VYILVHEAFISYSHVDKLAADAACDTLEGAGIRCWIAPRDIAPGAEWGEAIIEALDHSRVMVLIFSSNANESRQVHREVERAVSNGIIIIPVRIEQFEPTRSMAYFMAGVHWLDAFTSPFEQHLQRLVASTKALLATASRETINAAGQIQFNPGLVATSEPSPATTTPDHVAAPPGERVPCSRCDRDSSPATAISVDYGSPLAAVEAAPAMQKAAIRCAERRQVTVMFCDIVGSLSLSTSLDPEDMMNVVDVFQSACDDIIAKHGGYIAQYLGNGALAYFGYPSADEEDAANAIRAGLDLRDAMARLNLSKPAEPQARTGIATGLVVIHDIVSRGVVRQAGVVGETPNLAARLQALAPAGGIVVAEATRRITEGLFVYRPITPVISEGFAGAFEVIQATEVGSRSRARAQRAGSPLVGRAPDFATLVACWEKAQAGQGQVVLLQGEAGIGKSRLVEALRLHMADAPHVQSSWFCGPNNSDSALHPVAEHLARSAGFDGGESAAARHAKLGRLLVRCGVTAPQSAAIVADLLGLPPPLEQLPEVLTPEKRKEITIQALLAMMDGWANGKPALFVVEDLHWADSTTLDLLNRAVRLAEDRSWMILTTARPEFQNSWAEYADIWHIELTRLDRGNAERICTHLGATAVLSPEAVRQIIERCDGIPLFLEEMTKSILEGMATATLQGHAPRVEIPATLQASLIARLDRLGPARRIASLGAVIGRRFSYQLLAAIAALPPAELRQRLRDLTHSGLAERRGLPPDSTYLFKHALIRDAAYDSLLKREREGLHGQIATVLQERFPELRASEPELLAYHLTESGATAEAIPLWAAAGQRAASRAAHVEAVGHLKTALQLLRRQPADGARAAAELPLLLGLAVSQSATRGYSAPEVGEALDQARAICDAMGNVPELFAVLRNACSFYIVARRMAPAAETARLCLEIAKQTGLPEHLIESYYAQGYVLFMQGDLVEARRYLESSARLYREHDGARLVFPSPQDPLIGCLSALLSVLNAIGDDAGVDRVSADLAIHARALGRSYQDVYRLCFELMIASEKRNYTRMIRLADEAIVICDEQSFSLYGAIARFYKGIALGHLGQNDAGLDIAVLALDEVIRMGCQHKKAQWLGELAGLRLVMGDAAAAKASIDEAIADSEDSGETYALPLLYLRRAEVLAKIRSASAADIGRALDAAVDIAKAQGASGFVEYAEALRRDKQALISVGCCVDQREQKRFPSDRNRLRAIV
jgi:class 3 adenylate cyclase